MNSSPANPDERVGVLAIGPAVGVPLAVEVVAVGAMTSTTTKEEVTKDSRSMRAGRTKENCRAQAKSSLMSAVAEAEMHETGWHLNE